MYVCLIQANDFFWPSFVSFYEIEKVTELLSLNEKYFENVIGQIPFFELYAINYWRFKSLILVLTSPFLTVKRRWIGITVKSNFSQVFY